MNETAPIETGFYTEDMTISVGPQHPSTHGVLRFVVKTDGEVISEAIPDVGYLHRSIEKIGEKVPEFEVAIRSKPACGRSGNLNTHCRSRPR